MQNWINTDKIVRDHLEWQQSVPWLDTTQQSVLVIKKVVGSSCWHDDVHPSFLSSPAGSGGAMGGVLRVGCRGVSERGSDQRDVIVGRSALLSPPVRSALLAHLSRDSQHWAESLTRRFALRRRHADAEADSICPFLPWLQTSKQNQGLSKK